MDKTIDALRRLLKDFAKMPQPSQLIVAGVLVVAAFNFGQCDSESKINKFRAEYVALQKEARVATQFADKAKADVSRLVAESNQKDSTINKLSINIEISARQRTQLKGSLSRLEDSLMVAKDTAQIVTIQEGIIFNLKEQLTVADKTIEDQKQIINSQKYKITKLDSAVALATQRGDSLQTVINKFIKLEPPPRQWISKKTAGIIAFAAGVYVGHQVSR